MKDKIISTYKVTFDIVTIREPDGYEGEYRRYSKDIWYRIFSNDECCISEETTKALEESYQEFIKGMIQE